MSCLNRRIFQSHPYHLVSPILSSGSLLVRALSFYGWILDIPPKPHAFLGLPIQSSMDLYSREATQSNVEHLEAELDRALDIIDQIQEEIDEVLELGPAEGTPSLLELVSEIDVWSEKADTITDILNNLPI